MYIHELDHNNYYLGTNQIIIWEIFFLSSTFFIILNNLCTCICTVMCKRIYILLFFLFIVFVYGGTVIFVMYWKNTRSLLQKMSIISSLIISWSSLHSSKFLQVTLFFCHLAHKICYLYPLACFISLSLSLSHHAVVMYSRCQSVHPCVCVIVHVALFFAILLPLICLFCLCH
jgi:hypothetical protein